MQTNTAFNYEITEKVAVLSQNGHLRGATQ